MSSHATDLADYAKSSLITANILLLFPLFDSLHVTFCCLVSFVSTELIGCGCGSSLLVFTSMCQQHLGVELECTRGFIDNKRALSCPASISVSKLQHIGIF